MPTVVIGLDGADPELVERWIDDLPNFANIKETGFFGDLESIKPPITVPAWMCMFSGRGPQEFGAWDFQGLNKDNYEFEPVNSSYFKSKSIIDSDKKTISFRVPGTTPGYEINGHMISGFMIRERMEFNSEKLEEELNNDLDLEFLSIKEGDNREVASKNFEQNFDAFKWLLENKEFERAFSVFRIIDTYMHKISSEKEMKEAYKQVDRALGEFLEISRRKDWNLIIASDHGSGETRRKFYLNSWLREKGFTSYSSSEKTLSKTIMYKTIEIGLEIGLKPLMKKTKNLVEKSTGKELEPHKKSTFDSLDLHNSEAFSVLSAVSNFGAIWVHDNKRFPLGPIKSRKEKTLEIKEKLEKEDFIQSVYLNEEIYDNQEMPDLIVEAEDDTVVGGEVYPQKFHHTNAVVHNKKGLWMGEGPAFENRNIDARIIDVAPTIQAIDGVVDSYEGQPVKEVLANKEIKYEEELDIDW